MMAAVLDFGAERRARLRRGRQSLAIERVLAGVMAQFGDVDWLARPEDLSAAVALAIEQLCGNPDFDGEFTVEAVA